MIENHQHQEKNLLALAKTARATREWTKFTDSLNELTDKDIQQIDWNYAIGDEENLYYGMSLFMAVTELGIRNNELKYLDRILWLLSATQLQTMNWNACYQNKKCLRYGKSLFMNIACLALHHDETKYLDFILKSLNSVQIRAINWNASYKHKKNISYGSNLLLILAEPKLKGEYLDRIMRVLQPDDLRLIDWNAACQHKRQITRGVSLFMRLTELVAYNNCPNPLNKIIETLTADELQKINWYATYQNPANRDYGLSLKNMFRGFINQFHIYLCSYDKINLSMLSKKLTTAPQITFIIKHFTLLAELSVANLIKCLKEFSVKQILELLARKDNILAKLLVAAIIEAEMDDSLTLCNLLTEWSHTLSSDEILKINWNICQRKLDNKSAIHYILESMGCFSIEFMSNLVGKIFAPIFSQGIQKRDIAPSIILTKDNMNDYFKVLEELTKNGKISKKILAQIYYLSAESIDEAILQKHTTREVCKILRYTKSLKDLICNPKDVGEKISKLPTLENNEIKNSILYLCIKIVSPITYDWLHKLIDTEYKNKFFVKSNPKKRKRQSLEGGDEIAEPVI